jgi:hypothetical protein
LILVSFADLFQFSKSVWFFLTSSPFFRVTTFFRLCPTLGPDVPLMDNWDLFIFWVGFYNKKNLSHSVNDMRKKNFAVYNVGTGISYSQIFHRNMIVLNFHIR